MATPRGLNQELVRRQNLGVVLRHVHRAGAISRAALTTLTGLNRSTVGALVSDLAARGLVEEAEAIGRGQPGRPSPTVRPRTDRIVALAADVQVASLYFGIAGFGGDLRQRTIIDHTPDRRGPEATVEDLARLVERTVSDARVPPFALGVSVAGIVRREDGFVQSAPNLGWRDVPLGEMLRSAVRQRLGRDVPIRLGNDADLGAMAEHIRGAGAGVDNLIYVFSEVGVGGGIIVQGRPLVGAAGYAGEIGHIVVNPEGLACRCGGRGCLETEAGEWALLRHAGRTSGNERAAVDEILREAAAGGREALRALDRVGGWLGIGLATLVNVFNPNRIVLGGVLTRAYPYIADAVRRGLDTHAQANARALVTVLPAALGESSALMGAAELALEPVLANPTIIPVEGEHRSALG